MTGEDTWCQLFSEPGSGSDMAAATTRADFKGNKWIINGQKVWTTSAHKADWGLLLARTDWDVPKHKGLSYFLLNMRQPGVNVQPLRQMNYHASFNQCSSPTPRSNPNCRWARPAKAGRSRRRR
ncbi:MAG: acyl-CoA dehydrogenase family protein [Xanthobacteraceae bacterium]